MEIEYKSEEQKKLAIRLEMFGNAQIVAENQGLSTHTLDVSVMFKGN